MRYFILGPSDTEKDCINDSNVLGESSFNTFYSSAGLRALMKIVNETPELLYDIRIITDTNKRLSIEEFLADINKLKILHG
jgi:hypothetical protein